MWPEGIIPPAGRGAAITVLLDAAVNTRPDGSCPLRALPIT